MIVFEFFLLCFCNKQQTTNSFVIRLITITKSDQNNSSLLFLFVQNYVPIFLLFLLLSSTTSIWYWILFVQGFKVNWLTVSSQNDLLNILDNILKNLHSLETNFETEKHLGIFHFVLLKLFLQKQFSTTYWKSMILHKI